MCRPFGCHGGVPPNAEGEPRTTSTDTKEGHNKRIVWAVRSSAQLGLITMPRLRTRGLFTVATLPENGRLHCLGHELDKLRHR